MTTTTSSITKRWKKKQWKQFLAYKVTFIYLLFVKQIKCLLYKFLFIVLFVFIVVLYCIIYFIFFIHFNRMLCLPCLHACECVCVCLYANIGVFMCVMNLIFITIKGVIVCVTCLKKFIVIFLKDFFFVFFFFSAIIFYNSIVLFNFCKIFSNTALHVWVFKIHYKFSLTMGSFICIFLLVWCWVSISIWFIFYSL